MVVKQQGEYATERADIQSVAGTIGCSAEAPRTWVRQAERDAGVRPACGRRAAGVRPGPATDGRARLAALERENKALRRASDILRRAAAYVAQAGCSRPELDRPAR